MFLQVEMVEIDFKKHLLCMHCVADFGFPYHLLQDLEMLDSLTLLLGIIRFTTLLKNHKRVTNTETNVCLVCGSAFVYLKSTTIWVSIPEDAFSLP